MFFFFVRHNLKNEQSVISIHSKISKFVKLFSQKLFDIARKKFTRDYASMQKTKIEICDGGYHGMGELEVCTGSRPMQTRARGLCTGRGLSSAGPADER